MTGRDAHGRFTPGNPYASKGGKARAERLTSEQRKEIARKGFYGLVAQRFNDDRDAACSWLGKLGAWASDAPYRDSFPLFPHPGPCPGGER